MIYSKPFVQEKVTEKLAAEYWKVIVGYRSEDCIARKLILLLPTKT